MGTRCVLLLLPLLALLALLPLLLRRLPVKQDPLHVHAEFAHLLESFGSDEVLPLTVGLVFHNPLQLLDGFDEDTSNRKRIHRSETVLLLGLGCHRSPLEDGKFSALLSLVFRTR